jgi:hypothetical protein
LEGFRWYAHSGVSAFLLLDNLQLHSGKFRISKYMPKAMKYSYLYKISEAFDLKYNSFFVILTLKISC